MSSNRPSSISRAFLQERDPTRVPPRDGSETGAAGSAPSHEPRHASPGHPAHSSSRLGRIDTVTAANLSPSGRALRTPGAAERLRSWARAPSCLVARRAQRALQLCVRQRAGFGTDEYQVSTGVQTAAFAIDLVQGRSQAPPNPIADDGRPDPPTDAVRDPHVTGRPGIGRCVVGEVHHGHRVPPAAAPSTPERVERRTIADPSDQADSRARPLWRRARTIARPARVRMRSRKPCRLARLRLLGWYVRFTFCLLEHAASSQSQRGLRRDVELVRVARTRHAALRCADNARAPSLDCANPMGTTPRVLGTGRWWASMDGASFPQPASPHGGVRQRSWRLVRYLTSGCCAVIHTCGLLVDDFGCRQEGSGP